MSDSVAFSPSARPSSAISSPATTYYVPHPYIVVLRWLRSFCVSTFANWSGSPTDQDMRAYLHLMLVFTLDLMYDVAALRNELSDERASTTLLMAALT
jgi:hypothetical protein